ncbi:MAG: efflux RND transporter periplasmic adaptor subunit [Gammaproteobacteria bacterium]|nr:efflux RND transporter periplasmic adaptor subunit [Gammaproteobacteria bacterium]
MSKKARILAVGGLIVAILIVLVAWRVISNSHAGRGKFTDSPLPVDTTIVVRKSMPVQLQAVGQVQSEHTVNIQPQVGGVLKQVFFTEGQYVRKGQRLFLIDPAPYETALASARAAYLTARAQADREAPLAAKDYISPQDYQSALSAAAQTQAALQQAEINLSYTNIVSPIDGLTGNLVVKAGNVVSPGASAPLVTINQMKPILVQFNVPQNFLPQVRQYDAQHSIRVFITHEDGSGNLGQGKLVFIDNTINTSTGTVMLKAEVANKNVQLWPGQYVGVTIQLTVQPNAVVVPSTAIQSSEQGNFVYTVVKDTAVVQPVTVNRQIGDLAVISSGLNGGERVITRVSRNLRPDMKVTPNTTRVPAAGTLSMATP